MRHSPLTCQEPRPMHLFPLSPCQFSEWPIGRVLAGHGEAGFLKKDLPMSAFIVANGTMDRVIAAFDPCMSKLTGGKCYGYREADQLSLLGRTQQPRADNGGPRRYTACAPTVSVRESSLLNLPSWVVVPRSGRGLDCFQCRGIGREVAEPMPPATAEYPSRQHTAGSPNDSIVRVVHRSMVLSGV